jgi:hypothetical protein
MREAVMFAMIFGASYVGFSCLALGQARHWQAVVGAGVCPSLGRWFLRGSGALFLVASLAVSLKHEGVSYGILLWATSLTMAACCVVATLAFRPRLLLPVAWISRGMASGKAEPLK